MIPALTTWRANPPQFVTFTGADAQTSILGMQLLAEQFPVEWGILFSPERQGAGRYPPLEFVHELTERPGLRLAAHLCGGYALEFLDTLDCADLRDLLPAFQRVQINTSDTALNVGALALGAASRGWRVVLQCREAFPPEAHGVTWLFDASGGRGIRPAAWPAPPSSALVGYAGGLGPEWITEALRDIAPHAPNYYVDMETGIRQNDLFSIARCRDVLLQVYAGGGQRPWSAAERQRSRPFKEGSRRSG